jgi:hypothetical protein
MSIPIPVTPSHSRCPSRIPGLVGSNAAFLVPDYVRKEFAKGWINHVPLAYLTDKGCLLKNKPSVAASQEILTVDSITGQIQTTSTSFSDDGELDLIRPFFPDEFLMWEVHYNFILNNENRAELWPLYLAYDVEIRRRSTQNGIDPSQFSIGIWNDLEVRYTAKKVLSIVQSDLYFLNIKMRFGVLQKRINPEWLITTTLPFRTIKRHLTLPKPDVAYSAATGRSYTSLAIAPLYVSPTEPLATSAN